MVKNHRVAAWEMKQNNDSYCETSVLNDTRYSTGRRLLDLVDLHLFDFLTGNQDRHSYFVYRPFENDSSMINYDNGRGCVSFFFLNSSARAFSLVFLSLWKIAESRRRLATF